jgi:hypothetical protein
MIPKHLVREIGPFSGIFAAIWYEFGTVKGCSAGCSPLPFPVMLDGSRIIKGYLFLTRVVPQEMLPKVGGVSRLKTDIAERHCR